MSSDPDRIAVPTNGKRRRIPDDRAARPAAPVEGGAAAGDGAATERSAGPARRADLPGALSPQQLAVGFGIVASLVAARRRGWPRRRVRR